MTKTIEVKIANKGFEVGTLGWLLENLTHLNLSRTKSGKTGVWAEFKDSKYNFALAILDYWDAPGHRNEITLCEHSGEEEYMHGPSFPTTDACWKKIRELSVKAKELIEEKRAQDDVAAGEVELVRA